MRGAISKNWEGIAGMDMEAYKQKAIVLLGEYHKREAQVKLLKIEYQALEELTPGVSAVNYNQIAAHTNKVASMVEGEVQRIEQLPEQLAKIQRQITWLKMQNRKIDAVLESLSDPYRSLLKLKYIELLPWVSVHQRCTGYSEDYVRKNLNTRALQMFISLYYPETNQVGLFSEGCRCDDR